MDSVPVTEDAPTDGRLVVKWLEEQPLPNQKIFTEQKLAEYLEQAAQSRHSSGNACIKLCYFVEQCGESKASEVKAVANSQQTCLCLFNLYIEWNEKSQHRSMRQILELVVSLIHQNPDKEIAKAIKDSILHRNLGIIGHRSAQPLVKFAFKSLETLIAKGTVSTQELIDGYQVENGRKGISSSHLWDLLIEESFDWMDLPDVSPAAGKFLVTLFRALRATESSRSHEDGHASSWQRWIQKGLSKDPEALENVKTYLFPPLFKLDRPGSLLFLEQLNKQQPLPSKQGQELDSHALLQLAAMEVGKKLGLVEDPGSFNFQKAPKKKTTSIILHEATISPLLVHTSDTVRSLAFSVVVSSLSSTRPFTPSALQMLQSRMSILYSDTDAKFRNDVLSNTKHMIERLRGAIAFLHRESEPKPRPLGPDVSTKAPVMLHSGGLSAAIELKECHEKFVEWYLDFLLGELVPTSSYQRHITALKAIQLLLRTGILGQNSGAPPQKVTDNDTIWPFSIRFFNPMSLRLLLDLLLDPFEDVRSTATAILKLAPASSFSSHNWRQAHQMGAMPSKSDLNGERADLTYHTEFAIQTSDHAAKEGGVCMDILDGFIKRANEVSKRTGRADYADGVARSYELLYSLLSSGREQLALLENLLSNLESKVDLAENDLGRAVLEAPVHGVFASLNFILDTANHVIASDLSLQPGSWNELQVRLYKSCLRIWSAVKEVLCNDSPEGHLPQDLDETEIIDTKDILSYSFRAIHESSNLMRTLSSKIRLKTPDGSSVVPSSVFIGIGNLTFEQLSTLRHRGAFSTVSLTFARYCQLTQQFSFENSPDETILQRFYQGTLNCIFEQASTTRRSAGIPALVTGILSANSKTPAFPEVMEELKSLARRPVALTKTDETNLPQVHAMNCLKEIFKSATLGKRSESHLADGLQIAADSLNSEIWAIRNCGLLLLRSLIDCLFGTSESKSITEAGWDGRSIKLSYDKYPALPELLIKLLCTSTDSSNETDRPLIGAVESVFPALDIIRRAGPPESHREEIFSQVSNHLRSKVWHVREIAARTVCTLLMQDGWLDGIRKLLESCYISANKAHGTLTAIRFLLERRIDLDPASFKDALPVLVNLLPQSEEYFALERASPHVRRARIELVNTIFLVARQAAANAEQDALFSAIRHLYPQNGYEELKESLQTNSVEALLPLALIRRAIYTSELHGDALGPQKILQFTSQESVDLTLAALEILSPETVQISATNLGHYARAYMVAIENSLSSEIRAAAVTMLAQALDGVFSSHVQEHWVTITEVRPLSSCLRSGSSSPNLLNAEIRISGWLLLMDSEMSQAILRRETMEGWGEMLRSAGNVNKDFDTRFAAASAMHSFFAVSQTDIPQEDWMLSSLLALYDTLNDDDDEIRDMGAKTVSSILKHSLVPLAAREAFSFWLIGSFSGSLHLCKSALLRMTGTPECDAQEEVKLQLSSAESQLLASMQEDNALFVEEEQNLFIDEVREVKLWKTVFAKLLVLILRSSDDKRESLTKEIVLPMVNWVFDGLVALNNLAKEDGPFGWSSKPAAFRACTRILCCASAVLDFQQVYMKYTSEDPGTEIEEGQRKIELIRGELERVKAIPEFHPTLLGEGLAGDDSLKSRVSSWISHAPGSILSK